MVRIILVLFLIFPSQQLLAQADGSEPSTIEKYGPRRQISTIVYMGLAGAVLGLSTLSFYGKPQDHLTNIPLGFGLGVVMGTVYMTYQAATNPDEFYREASYHPNFKLKQFNDKMATDLFYRSKGPDFIYTWTF